MHAGLLIAVLIALSKVAVAQEYSELRKTLTERMPDVTIGQIRQLTDVPLLEVQANGNAVFYTNEKGTYAFFGNLVDIVARTNLTDVRKRELLTVDFSSLPLDKAIKTVRGNGDRKLAVFSDPDCPYCKQLEQELAKLTNVTIYTFLYPIASIHPDAPRKSRLIWCAEDRVKAWENFMLNSQLPDGAAVDCEAPLGVVEEIARKSWITGTPGMVFENDQLVPGVVAHAQIEQLLTASDKP